MSNERFGRIEGRLDELKTDVAVLKTDVAVLKTDVAVLKTDVASLATKYDRLDNRVEHLHDRMEILHAEVIDNIRAIPDPVPQMRRMLDAAVTDLREEIGRRLDPLEAAVKYLSGRSR